MSELHECLEVRALLPELVIGAAAGDERARALGHVAGCPDCRHELRELTTTADALLQLAPRVEPPPGFEGRVLARLVPPIAPGSATAPTAPAAPVQTVSVPSRSPSPAPSWRRRVVLVLAFAVAVALSLGTGMTVAYRQTAEDRRLADQYRQTLATAGGRYLKAARISTADGQPVGTVFFYQGSPSWLLLTISSAPTDGSFTVIALDRRGAAHHIGLCQVANGTVTAGYRIDLAVAEIARIQLHSTDPAGAVLTAVT